MAIFMSPVRAGALILFLLGCGAFSARGEVRMRGGKVIVVPEQTEEILANPDVGWETFHRTAARDRNLPDWIPSTVMYVRWYWKVLEPERGRLSGVIDAALAEARGAGQKLAFRVKCCGTGKDEMYCPGWLKEIGCGGGLATYGSGTYWVPDMDDPVFLETHLDLIRRLGERYDGHRDLSHVDIGSVGWWGEWHMSEAKARMPTLGAQKKIIDAYFSAFKQTPLLMLIGGKESLQYAVGRGAGWRADCLGDMGGFSKTWCHMRNMYPAAVRGWKALEAWKQAPVAWESGWDMRKWVQEHWPLRHIFNYALAFHASYLNNKSAPLPEGEQVRAEIERFLRRLGHRLVLRRAEYAAEVRAGRILTLRMQWQNIGSAPCYKPYRLAYRFTGGNAEEVVLGETTVEGWMPGSVDVTSKDFIESAPDLPPGEVVDVVERIRLPAGLRPGTYTLSVGVVAARPPEPVIQLGIKGRDEKGWYPLSEVAVTRRSPGPARPGPAGQGRESRFLGGRALRGHNTGFALALRGVVRHSGAVGYLAAGTLLDRLVDDREDMYCVPGIPYREPDLVDRLFAR